MFINKNLVTPKAPTQPLNTTQRRPGSSFIYDPCSRALHFTAKTKKKLFKIPFSRRQKTASHMFMKNKPGQ